MKKKGYLILILIVTILFTNCNSNNSDSNGSNKGVINESVINTSELESYFQTSDIEVKVNGDVLSISIVNSGLVENKQKKMGQRWVNAEALASVGASIVTKAIDTNLKVETIVFNIKTGNSEEKYAFSFIEFKKVNKYILICEDFLQVVNKKPVSELKEFLDDRILNEPNLDNIFSEMFPDNRVVKTKLAGVKIERGIASLYIDVFFDDDAAQTYAFSFNMSEDNQNSKIVGITLP